MEREKSDKFGIIEQLKEVRRAKQEAEAKSLGKPEITQPIGDVTELKVKEVLNSLHLFVLDQFRSRGSDWYQEQVIQVMERHLEPNLDFWNSILSGDLRAGLALRGVSEHKGRSFDARDAGFINCGTGNHIASTIRND